MVETGEENPLFAEFDYLMEILLEEEVVASLGDGMRPGCHHDAGGSRRQRSISPWGCRRNGLSRLGVQRMIEGPRHIPLGQVSHNIRVTWS